MWAQLVKWRVKPGNDEALQQVGERWEQEVGRGTDSGWVRTSMFTSTAAPNEWYQIVYFESEEKARANERNEKHQAVVGELMSLLDGEPEFVDLTPMQESSR
jgi:quinol monooxygenase YgiN